MEFTDTLKHRISCRAFLPTAVSAEDLDAVLSAGCNAPSPLNQQPWSFVVVRNPATIRAVADHVTATRDRVAEASGKSWVAKYDSGFVGQAPVLIAVAADPSKVGLGAFLDEAEAHVKAGCASIENMLLAAADRGLGSMWLTMYDKAEVKRLLGIDPGLDVVGILPLGHPQGEPKPVPKRSPAEVTRYID